MFETREVNVIWGAIVIEMKSRKRIDLRARPNAGVKPKLTTSNWNNISEATKKKTMQRKRHTRNVSISRYLRCIFKVGWCAYVP